MPTVRFLDGDWPPNSGQRALMIGLAFDEGAGVDRGQMRESVRPATAEETELHGAEFEKYTDDGGALKPPGMADDQRGLPSIETPASAAAAGHPLPSGQPPIVEGPLPPGQPYAPAHMAPATETVPQVPPRDPPRPPLARGAPEGQGQPGPGQPGQGQPGQGQPGPGQPWPAPPPGAQPQQGGPMGPQQPQRGPPQQGYPPPQPGYPPPQPGYPPPQQAGYPPPQQAGYPPPRPGEDQVAGALPRPPAWSYPPPGTV